MIKLAYIIPTLSMGGAEVQQINILNGFIDEEIYQIHLYVLKKDVSLLEEIKNRNVVVTVLDFESIFSVFPFFSLLKSLILYKPDIIHTHMYSANLLGRLIKVFLPNTSLVNHFHGLSPWFKKRHIILERLTKNLVNQFIVVSEKSYKIRLEREKYPSSSLTYLPNSVRITEKPVFSENNLKKVRFGVASRLIPLKNVRSTISLLGRLSNYIDCELIIAGDGPELNPLKKYALQLGISDKVTFLGYCSDMFSFYQSIDVYLLASEVEDLPLSLLEALYMGKVVISTPVGGIPSVLSKVVNGYTFESLPDMFEKILNIVENTDFKSAAILNHEYAYSNFSEEIYMKNLFAIYTKLYKGE